MSKLKVFVLCFLIVFNFAIAKEITVNVVTKDSEISAEFQVLEAMELNGLRQAMTRELEELKLDSEIYWEKVDKKKMSQKAELAFLKTLFSNTTLSRPAVERNAEAKAEAEAPMTGRLTAEVDLDKLKIHYDEIINDLEDTKLKTLYIISNIELDQSMTWEDVGVTRAENFSGVILDSWKKLFEKDFKGFEKIVILEKDFPVKPDYMNSKSVSLKWKSIIKKIPNKTQTDTATYEISAQYILQNSKSGNVLRSLDFPMQKRVLAAAPKKALSSTLASLVYNLLFSESAKIQSVLETDAKALEFSEIEISMATKAGLLEISQVNTLLQEKFAGLKLTSRMKSFSTDKSTLLIRAEGTEQKILDSLSSEGGKFPLNEQKVLLFNRADKTFAIIPKESNN